MEKESPNYYAILPANVRYNKRLNPNAKLLYAEITALTNKLGYCYASNDYFAKLYDVSKTSISKWISLLANCGYFKIELIYKEGTKQILNRYITLIKDPIEEKLNTPIEEKLKDNNTSNNIKYNTYIEEIKNFYKLQSELNKTDELINGYQNICKYLFGNNFTNDNALPILKIKTQLSYENYKTLVSMGCKVNIIFEKFDAMLNKPVKIKDCVNLFSTLKTWYNCSKKKGFN